MVQLLLDKARALLAPAPKFYFGLCSAVGVFWLVVALNLIVCAARAYYFYGVEDRIFSRIFEDFCCILIINLLIFHLCFVIFRRFFGLAALFVLAINTLCAAISLFLVVFFRLRF